MDTKAIISDALRKLSATHGLDDIRVQMILDEAHVSRSTFYRHFTDVFDLVCYHYSSFLSQFDDEVWTKRTFVSNLEYSLSFLQANRSYFTRILRSSGRDRFLELLEDYAYDSYLGLFRKYNPEFLEKHRTKAERYSEILAFGASKMVCNWLASGDRTSPHELAECIGEMVPPVLSSHIPAE